MSTVLAATDNVRVAVDPQNRLQTGNGCIAQWREQWFAVLGQSNEQRSHIPIDVRPFGFQKLDAAQARQQQKPDGVACVVIRLWPSGVSSNLKFKHSTVAL